MESETETSKRSKKRRSLKSIKLASEPDSESKSEVGDKSERSERSGRSERSERRAKKLTSMSPSPQIEKANTTITPDEIDNSSGRKKILSSNPEQQREADGKDRKFSSSHPEKKSEDGKGDELKDRKKRTAPDLLAGTDPEGKVTSKTISRQNLYVASISSAQAPRKKQSRRESLPRPLKEATGNDSSGDLTGDSISQYNSSSSPNISISPHSGNLSPQISTHVTPRTSGPSSLTSSPNTSSPQLHVSPGVSLPPLPKNVSKKSGTYTPTTLPLSEKASKKNQTPPTRPARHLSPSPFLLFLLLPSIPSPLLSPSISSPLLAFLCLW